jgi:Fur family ferric uptake transcriptional regulator
MNHPAVHARDRATRLLRGAGQRATPQRIIVLESLVEAAEHLTADQVYTQVSARLPSMTLSTVYRTLERLRDIGLVTETDLGEGVRHFELLEGERHHHLICQNCGYMFDLDDRAVDALRERIVRDYDFAPRLDHLAVFGLCAHCQSADHRNAENA